MGTVPPPNGRALVKKRSSCPDLVSSLKMFSMDMPCIDLPSPAHVLDGIGSAMLLAGSDTTTKGTAIEAGGMNWMAHALLDFSGHWTQGAVTLRSAEVIGRLMVLGQTLLPGHHMMLDELILQLGFFAVSCNSLYKVAEPKIKASRTSKFLTAPDRKAFRSLFKPTGLTWSQYREMSVDVMEWVTLKPGEVILSNEKVDDDAMYWLYQGDVNFASGDIVGHISGGEKFGASLLLGDDRLAQVLDLSPSLDDEDSAASKTTAVSGAGGATLLKISASQLEKTLKHDQSLVLSANRLLMKSLQGKNNLSRDREGRVASPAAA